MTDEHELVPYAAEPLLGDRVLVLAPHPDDEIIGCGGVIAINAREGRSLRVVVITDGSEALEQGYDPMHASLREEESQAGLTVIGAGAPRFLRLRDRTLSASIPALKTELRDEILRFTPDLILCPGPNEVHPDHAAVAAALFQLVNSDELIGETLLVARIAFYEVSQPIRPNLLVDITPVADLKYAALGEHGSQNSIRDYEAFSRGLNRYRSMTLGESSEYAEAYWVTTLKELRTIPWSHLEQRVGGTARVTSVYESIPVSVLIRTRNRLSWLREAVESVRASGYPAHVIVLNDGGASATEALSAFTDVQLIEHSASRGRSEAMNSAVNAARTELITFLDDDDLYYPEHLEVLATASRTAGHVAWYTEALSAFYTPGPSGNYSARDRLRLYSGDFDRDLLAFDNYIPLLTVMTRRSDFLDAGGFDPAFDLFEDWDFLLRLSARGTFLHIPRMTCEIRHFSGSDSAVLAAPEGSDEFRRAKLKVWEKHKSRLTPNAMATVFERQKRRLNALNTELADKRGEREHLSRDVSRLERDKSTLIARIQKDHESTVTAVLVLEGKLQQSEAMLAAAQQRAEEQRSAASQLTRANLDASRVNLELSQTLDAHVREVARLQGLLDTIYSSKTWKLHLAAERIRGRRG